MVVVAVARPASPAVGDSRGPDSALPGAATTTAAAAALLNCTAAAANGCGGSCCGCVCLGCGFCSTSWLLGCGANSWPAMQEGGGPASGKCCCCQGGGSPRLLAVLSTMGDAVGALVLSSQLDVQLSGMREEGVLLIMEMGTGAAGELLPGVPWSPQDDAQLTAPPLNALRL